MEQATSTQATPVEIGMGDLRTTKLELEGHLFLIGRRGPDERPTYLSVSIDSVLRTAHSSGVTEWEHVAPSYRVPIKVRDDLENFLRGGDERYLGNIDWWFNHITK